MPKGIIFTPLTKLLQKSKVAALGQVRLSLAASLGLKYAVNRKSEFDCGKLFSPGMLALQIATHHRKKGMQAERLGPLIHRQSARFEQGIFELAINAIEGVSGRKIVGRFGEGRIQNLKQIVGNKDVMMEVVTKTKDGPGRGIIFHGLEGEKDDVKVELGLVGNAARGTRVSVKKRLARDEQNKLIAYLEEKLRYLKGLQIFVNGRGINEGKEIKSLLDRSKPKTSAGKVEISITDEGYAVTDNGKGMDAETIVKRYLAIGNSEGEHERIYDDDLQSADVYYAAAEKAVNKGRVSFLLCGVEIEGVEVKKLNIEEKMGIELGTGLKRTVSMDKVVLDKAECARIKSLADDLLKIKGKRKWTLLNTLMTALDEAAFVNGEKKRLLDAIYARVSAVAAEEEKKGEIVFVPNRKGFADLSTDKEKVYLDERLFDFNLKVAGMEEHQHYQSQRGYRLFLGKIKGDAVFLEVGKNLIVNQKYAKNILLINLLFNYWVGYGPKIKGEVEIALPWGTGELQKEERLRIGPEEKIMRSGKTRKEAQVILKKLTERMKQAEKKWGETVDLEELIEKKATVEGRVTFRGWVSPDGEIIYRAEKSEEDKKEYVLGVVTTTGENKIISKGYIEADWPESNPRPGIQRLGERVFITGFRKEGGEQIGVVEEIISGGIVKPLFKTNGSPYLWNTGGKIFIGGKMRKEEEKGVTALYELYELGPNDKTQFIAEIPHLMRIFLVDDRLFVTSVKEGADYFPLVLEELVNKQRKAIAPSDGRVNVFKHGESIFVYREEGKKLIIEKLDSKEKVFERTFADHSDCEVHEIGGRILITLKSEHKGFLYELTREGKVKLISDKYSEVKVEDIAGDEKSVFLVVKKGKRYGSEEYLLKVLTADGKMKPISGGYNYDLSLYKAGGSMFVVGGKKEDHFRKKIFIKKLTANGKLQMIAEGYNAAVYEGGGKVFIVRAREEKSSKYYISNPGITMGDYDIWQENGVVVEELTPKGQLKLISSGYWGVTELPRIVEREGRVFIQWWDINRREERDALNEQEIVFDGDEAFVIPHIEIDSIEIGSDRNNKLAVNKPTEFGARIDSAFPPQLPAVKDSFEEQANQAKYAARRRTMIERILRGDYEDYQGKVDLEVFGYLGAEAVLRLGENLSIQLSQRIKGKDFHYQDLYLQFITKVWAARKGEIDVELFQQIVERWDSLFESYGDDMGEIKRLARFFDKTNIYHYLSNGRKDKKEGEVETWLTFFKEKDLGKIVAMRKLRLTKDSGKILGEAGEHDLTFYLWAARERGGWEKAGFKTQAKLLKNFSQLDNAPLQNRLIGTVLGQDLEEFIYAREMAQNSRDAASKELKIDTYGIERDGKAHYVAEYADDGVGMSGEEVKGLLLNIEVSAKEGAQRQGGKKAIGENGIGFETIFKDSHIVRGRTSKGDGVIAEFEAECVRSEGRLQRIKMNYYRERKGKMQGTWIQAEKEMGESDLKGTKIKTALAELMFGRRLAKYVGLVRDMAITHNGKGLRKKVLAKEKMTSRERGTYALLETDDLAESVAQDGLWINDKKKVYLKYIPEILRETVERCVFEIGEKEKLTRGRGEVMEEEEVVGKIFFILAARKALKEHLSGERRIMGLPQDYLFGQDKEFADGDLEGKMPDFVQEDAARINNGKVFNVDITRYLGKGQKDFIKLLTLIEVKGKDGVKVTLQALRDEARNRAKRKRAEHISSSSLLGSRFKQEMGGAVLNRMIKASESDQQEVSNLSAVQQKFLDLVHQALQTMGVGSLSVSFRSSPQGSWRAKGNLSGIAYRLEDIDFDEVKEVIDKIKKGKIDAQVYHWYFKFLEILAHEAVHVLYYPEDDWSHGADPRIDHSFAYHMKKIILEWLRNSYNPLN